MLNNNFNPSASPFGGQPVSAATGRGFNPFEKQGSPEQSKGVSFGVFLLGAAILFLTACNLEQDIELELPAYEARTVVESYLEPGKPFTLLLTRSDGFFAPFGEINGEYLENLLYDGAEVRIRYGDEEVVLENQTVFDPVEFEVFNYASSERVPADNPGPYFLDITTVTGERITAETVIPARIEPDSIVVEFAEGDTLARLLTYFSDPDPETDNYFRRLLYYNVVDSLEQDFTATDDFVDGDSPIVFGSGYDLPEGDSYLSILYHITPEYYAYLNSVDNAVSSNGNPFGAPGIILSNVKGEENPLGIFTGLDGEVVTTEVRR